MEPINYFDILGVDSKATMGEIKKAYRKLALKYHPDHDVSNLARKKFIQITKAYKILVDPVKREEYIQGKNIAVTDKPWEILINYWEMIYKKGFSI